jgi:hypothetical protein
MMEELKPYVQLWQATRAAEKENQVAVPA